MLQPKTLAALAFLAAAGGAAAWQLTRVDRHIETIAPASPLPRFAASDIDELILDDAAGQTRTALRKDGETWRLTAPLGDAADGHNVIAALNELADARVAVRPATRARSSWARLRVGDDQALTVVLREAGGDVATLHLSSDAHYLRVGDGDAVYAVKGINRALLVREPRAWRDRVITAFDPKHVSTMTVIDAAGARAVAARTPAGDGQDSDSWRLTEGAGIVGTFDPGEVTGAVSRMQHLVAQDIADDQTPSGAGLDAPRVRVEIGLEDGRVVPLLVGNDADDKHVYVGRADRDRVWLAAKPTIDSFAKPPLQWRDKTIARLPPADVTRIDIRRGGDRVLAVRDGDGWRLERPVGAPADPARLDALAGAMQNLRGVAVATETSPKITGLRRPGVVATFTTRDGATTTVAFGAKHDGTWYARSSDRDDVLRVADYLARRFQIGPADVTAAPR